MIIAIEGAEYTGKTTVVSGLQKLGYTTRRQPEVPLTRKFIKGALLHDENCPSHVLALAYALDRAYAEYIAPFGEGDVTITDRSIFSSLIMQQDDDRVSSDYIYLINRFTTIPDLVIWLRAKPHTILERIEIKNNGRTVEDLHDAHAIHWLNKYEQWINKPYTLGLHTIFTSVHVDNKSEKEILDDVVGRITRFVKTATP